MTVTIAPPGGPDLSTSDAELGARPWQACTVAEVEGALGTDRDDGLSSLEATTRLLRYGPNGCRPRRRRPCGRSLPRAGATRWQCC